jgi:acetyl-CoA C-acetyltransferase
MSEVVIAGIGQIPVGEHWELPLHTLSSRAILAALGDAGGLKPQAMYVGNFLASVVSHQANLPAQLADHVGLTGIEGITAEAAGASGAAAFRLGYLAVASGFVDVALVVGVEKVTDVIGADLESAISLGADYDFECVPGMNSKAAAGLLMQRYLYEYRPPRQAFGEFAVLAHANAVHNPNAMYRRAISAGAYEKAAMVASPLNLYDVAPYADGAAAVVLTRAELAEKTVRHKLVRVSGSSSVIDTLALHDRSDPLAFQAAAYSVERACRKAGILPQDVDLFELTDAFSVYAALSLEAAGFAKRGEGWKLAQEGALSLNGKLPILTMGGFKGRGNPLAASGVYQIVEAALQLRGEAGTNQAAQARRALVQTLGGPASTAITHVLEAL